MLALPVAAREVNSGVDRGVGGSLQENELTDAKPEKGLRPVVPLRQRAMKEAGDNRIDLAETAKGSGNEVEGEGAVSGIQRCPIRVALGDGFKRKPPPQDGIESLQGDGAGIEGRTPFCR